MEFPGLQRPRHRRSPGALRWTWRVGTVCVRSHIAASAPGARGGYGGPAIPRALYHASVTSSTAKIPLYASASAIMLAMVFRDAIGSLQVAVDQLHRHALSLRRPPLPEQGQHDVLAAHPGLQHSAEHHAPGLRQGGVDVTGSPAKTKRRGSDSDANRAVHAVRRRLSRSAPGMNCPGRTSPCSGK